jgi:phytanoyl-CoA hydroxylase
LNLSSSQINSFNENGFIIIDDFFNLEDLSNFENSLQHLIINNLKKSSKIYPEISVDKFRNSIFDEGLITLEKLDHQYVADIYDTICQVPEFLRLITKKETSKYINQLLNRNLKDPLYTFTCRCRIDPPNDDRRKTKWHQEVFYSIPKSNFLQTWAPLVNDVNRHNGTIQVCVGSHKEGIANQSYDVVEGGANPFVIDENIVQKYDIIDIEMKKGQFMIFNSRLFHRSGNNYSDKVRYSLVGMYHDVDNPNFEPPILSFKYNKSPKQFFDDVFAL